MPTRSRDALIRLAAATIAVAAAAFLAIDLRPAYRATAARIAQDHGIPARERRIQGAFGLQISRDFLIEAHAFVAGGESYALIPWPKVYGLADPGANAFPAFVSYARFPRGPRPSRGRTGCSAT